MYYGLLLHLGYNMWNDQPLTEQEMAGVVAGEYAAAADHLRCDKGVWRSVTQRLLDAGGNMLVVDVGEGVRFESHPELAVDGSWSAHELREEVRLLREAGLTVVPKLNFSAAHDIWLKDYSRMLSTPRYYQVCADVISETIDIFDNPELFHLGMDEETPAHQQAFQFVAARQGDLWWHDVRFLVGEVERAGVQAWVWADHAWRDRENYLKKMPKSVVQSNWYYARYCDERDVPTPDREYRLEMLRAFDDLDEHGFDQIPCGANSDNPYNLGNLVDRCRARISADRLKGFLQTSWFPTLPAEQPHIDEAIDLLGKVAQ